MAGKRKVKIEARPVVKVLMEIRTTLTPGELGELVASRLSGHVDLVSLAAGKCAQVLVEGLAK